MPITHWRDPNGVSWKVQYGTEFDGDVLFVRYYPDRPGFDEAFSECSYILRIVKQEWHRPKPERRKELVLSARDIKGKHAILHIPFELLLTVVAKGYVAPKMFQWLYDMNPERLMVFIPLADAGKRGFKFPKKLIAECLQEVTRTSRSSSVSQTSMIEGNEDD